MHGKADPLEGGEQALHAVRERDGRGGVRQQRGTHHQQHQAQGEEHGKDDALEGDAEDPPFPVHRLAAVKEQVERRGEQHKESDTAHRAQHLPQRDAREQHGGAGSKPVEVGGKEDRHDIGDEKYDLQPRIEAVDKGVNGIELPEGDVFHALPPFGCERA